MPWSTVRGQGPPGKGRAECYWKKVRPMPREMALLISRFDAYVLLVLRGVTTMPLGMREAIACHGPKKNNLVTGHAYLFRVRARAEGSGVWSTWSAPSAPIRLRVPSGA